MLENIDAGILAEILTLILGLVTSIIGPKYRKSLKKYKAMMDVIEDGEITKEEAKKIKKTLERI